MSSDATIPASEPNHRPPLSSWEVGGALVVFVVRLLFGVERRVYSVYADEPATLAMARWLSGGVPWQLFDNATWKPGLAVLLAPVYTFTDDAEAVYRSGLLINSVIAGITVIVAARVGRRVADVSPRASVVAACIVALAPASLFASAAVWAEPLVSLTFLAGVLATMRTLETGSQRHGVAAISWAVAGYLAHNRMIVMLPIVVVAVIGSMLRARRWRGAAALTLWFTAGTGAVAGISTLAVRRLWGEPTQTNTIGSVLRQLGSPLAILDAGIGQIWYVMVATGGMFAIGLVALLRSFRDTNASPTRRIDVAVLLTSTAAHFALSAVFMADRPRADHLVYGRYVDAIIWPVLIVAVGWTWNEVSQTERRSGTWLLTVAGSAAAVLATGIVVQLAHARDFNDRPTAMQMVPGLAWLTPGDGVIRPIAATGVALVLLTAGAMVAALHRRPVWLVPALAATVVVVAGALTRTELGRDANVLTAASSVRLVEDLIPSDAVVGYRFTVDSAIPLDNQRAFAQAFQFYLSDVRFEADDGPTDGVGPYVFAPEDDPQMIVHDAELLYLDPRIGIGLWREPDALVDE